METAATAAVSTSISSVERTRAAYARIDEVDRPDVWITLRSIESALEDAERVDREVAAGRQLPLAGCVVAVKDNVDVAGLPTTAACVRFGYVPDRTAPAVQQLMDAGAVVLGKTNLDQFATGLVGTRSPYGVVRHAWLDGRIAGGSSSGSAVAVALGIADLGVGTDTAGSGRVPAALHGIVGFKTTPGVVSTSGVVPACPSYDCVTIFASSLAAAESAVWTMADPRVAWPAGTPLAPTPQPVVAVPAGGVEGLSAEGAAAFAELLELLEAAGAVCREIDLGPFLAASRLLYGSALVAERYASFGAFVEAQTDGIDPSVRSIVEAARGFRAHELVRARCELEALRDAASAALGDADALVLPTVLEHPTLDAVVAAPLAVNARLGRLTSFANLFQMPAVAVPAGRADGGPFGVTVLARPYADRVAAGVAALVTGEGGAGASPPAPPALPLLVLGAHMRGQPLNRELTGRGAAFVADVCTAPRYRMYALATSPPKPGLLAAPDGGGSIEGELWHVPPAALAVVLASLPEPMTLGPVELADGGVVTGFFCQAAATAGAREITALGSWRRFLEES